MRWRQEYKVGSMWRSKRGRNYGKTGGTNMTKIHHKTHNKTNNIIKLINRIYEMMKRLVTLQLGSIKSALADISQTQLTELDTTMVIRNMKVKTRFQENKALVEPKVSKALNNISPVIMSSNLAYFHNKTKVTFVVC